MIKRILKTTLILSMATFVATTAFADGDGEGGGDSGGNGGTGGTSGGTNTNEDGEKITPFNVDPHLFDYSEIAIDAAASPIDPEIERGITTPKCRAFLLNGTFVQVDMYDYIGNTTVTIKDGSNAIIENVTFDSAVMFSYQLNSLSAGNYTITVTGSEGYTGTGSFSVN